MSSDNDLKKQLADKLIDTVIETSTNGLVSPYYYERKLLVLFAEIENNPGIAHASLTNESSIGDYFLCYWEEDIDRCDQILQTLKLRLGVDVRFKDRLVDLAKKLKN